MAFLSDMPVEPLKSALDFFPMEEPRPTQVTALNFITKAFDQGYPDMVIAAPTGTGKSFIGSAACLWGGSFNLAGCAPGGYYLVMQKMLQDQLENDFPRFQARFRTSGALLKSASEYPCPKYGNCMAARLATKVKGSPPCPRRQERNCTHQVAKWRFNTASIAVTNYPYLFTEHIHVKELKPRNFVIADEAHNLERQITGFVEVLVNKESLDNWAPDCRPVPVIADIEDFAGWLRERYLKTCQTRLEMLEENLAMNRENRKMQEEHTRLGNHIRRLDYAVGSMLASPEEWVYWQEMRDGERECVAKPLSAAPFMPGLIQEMGATRLYLSAYLGPKEVFCRSLGLDARKVAWLELDSAFPVENRQVHMTTVGSMGRAAMADTLPRLLGMCETILEAHPLDRGIIHSHTYTLGQQIYQHLLQSPAGRGRVLFASKASERASVFNRHQREKTPTVIISPSMGEGYSFNDGLARFQIIAKCPYGFLGDRQVRAKMERDREWYVLQTVMSFLQTCGRLVRSENDFGETYVLDSDVVQLFQNNEKFFPPWFKAAFKFY
jgi:Rad3-related DNA helicase